MKIRPLTAELFHADGRTNTNLIAAFSDFANMPKKAQIFAKCFQFVTSAIRLLFGVTTEITHPPMSKTHKAETTTVPFVTPVFTSGN
jgi:hypothetical protein